MRDQRVHPPRPWRHPVLVQVGEGSRLQGGRHARLRRDVDELARSTAAGPQAQQDGDRRVDARKVLGLVLRQVQRRAVGIAGLGEHPAQRGHDEIGALPAAARADQSERRDAHVHQVIEALGGRPGSFRCSVEQDIGARQEAAQAVGVGRIQGHRALPGVPVGEAVAVLVPVRVAARGFHQHHFMAEPDQQAAREPGEGAGQFDDARGRCAHVSSVRRQPCCWFRKPLTTLW